MASAALIAVLAAFGFALYGLLFKVMLRYRVCSASLVGWSITLAAGAVAAAAMVVDPPRWQPGFWPPMLGMSAFWLLGIWLLARAMQEGDVSTVMPVMGAKIPITAVLSWLLLGEQHGLAVYLAVALAAGGVVLFTVGAQQATPGGRAPSQTAGVLLACGSALSYSLSDILGKVCIDHSNPLTVTFISAALSGAVCLPILMLPRYRVYRIARLDVLLICAGGAVLVPSMLGLFWAFGQIGVTIPNILLALRGFFLLVIGYLLGRTRWLPHPIETQSRGVYLLRLAGTAILFASVLMIVLR